jgi:glycogen debranching enzyme
VVDQWLFSGESVAIRRPGIVTLVDGSAFCISEGSADIVGVVPQGLFYIDTRLVSYWRIKVNGQFPEPLVASSDRPFHGSFISRTRPLPGLADSSFVIVRDRYIGRGMREDVRITNYSVDAAPCTIEVEIQADFAEIFAVKEGRVEHPAAHRINMATLDELSFCYENDGIRRKIALTFSEQAQQCSIDGSTGHASFAATIPSRGTWTVCLQVTPTFGDDVIEPSHRCGEPIERALPAIRLSKWREDAPVVETDWRDLRALVAQGVDDLAGLRLTDPEYPDRFLIAAGVPWFMTVFGRDSLITSWMALLVDPQIAVGVLQTLARFQGKAVNPETEEEPGRILHELRFGEAGAISLDHWHAYYGSVDATPLFVMLLGELRRWGIAQDVVDELLPHADRALEWIDRYGDRDGDGYVEYERSTPRGLANQGWKDSWDGVRFADGSLPEPPIAMAEVQGYVYSAFLARHFFAREQGDVPGADYWRDRARTLKAAFNRDFWLPEQGWYAMALDRDKRPVDALASNMGHCLWTGIVDQDKVARVVDLLLGPEMFSGWGVRTLATSMAGYNPLGYHTGSIWPHDNAIIAAGLMRYGYVAEAQRIITALTEAATSESSRLPELFSGLDRRDFPSIVSYPASCVPQAWDAATPLSFLRTLLRFEPWVPEGKVWMDPALPARATNLCVQNVPLAGRRLTLRVDGDKAWVEHLPPHLTLIQEPRPPQTSV